MRIETVILGAAIQLISYDNLFLVSKCKKHFFVKSKYAPRDMLVFCLVLKSIAIYFIIVVTIYRMYQVVLFTRSVRVGQGVDVYSSERQEYMFCLQLRT